MPLKVKKADAKKADAKKDKKEKKAKKAEKKAAAPKPAKKEKGLLFETRRSEIQGTGAFAIKPIRAGKRIVEYVGEQISSEEADRRYDESKMKRHHTFLFTVEEDLVVDGGSNGNEAIYINHSCDPNCEAVIDEKNRIWIYALRDIKVGEELAYDYQFERTGSARLDAQLEKFYACRCGAERCRGSLLKKKKIRRRDAAKKDA
ncbi:SET domain-containing protein [Roseiterribacter gracilis]